jgi:DNA-binding transcriptional MerR regulator
MNGASEVRCLRDLRFSIAHIDSICDALQSGALDNLNDVESAWLAQSMAKLAKVTAQTEAIAYRLSQRVALTDRDKADADAI